MAVFFNNFSRCLLSSSKKSPRHRWSSYSITLHSGPKPWIKRQWYLPLIPKVISPQIDNPTKIQTYPYPTTLKHTQLYTETHQRFIYMHFQIPTQIKIKKNICLHTHLHTFTHKPHAHRHKSACTLQTVNTQYERHMPKSYIK